MSTPENSLSGGCQCGAIRYRLTAPPSALYVCHCRECQRQSGSAFGVTAIVAMADFRIERGDPRLWARPTDSGGRLDCAFCGGCGTRIFHQRSATPHLVSIKGGTLDTPPDLTEAVHIWTDRRLPGVMLPPRATTYPAEPPD